MIQLSSLQFEQFQYQMKMGTLKLDLGLARFAFQSTIPSVLANLYRIYADYPLADQPLAENTPCDHQVAIRGPQNIRRWVRPQVQFYDDINIPFLPLPIAQAYPMLEWGMNWSVTSSNYNYLMLHAAVLEKNGEAYVFPAPPGSGKSTLTAYLAYSGWRLLSDEMTIINLDTYQATPFVRPICLKNNSIDLVKQWFPDVVCTPITSDTSKGDVAHFKPLSSSVAAFQQPAKIKAVIFPRYSQNQTLTVEHLSIAAAFTAIAENSFNHSVLGQAGFDGLVHLAEHCQCINIEYDDLRQVEQFLLSGIEP